MKEKLIRIAEQYSRYPAGRYRADGPASGERFRDEYLAPVLRANEHAVINLDGTRGFGSSFLEEAFGGLRRIGFSEDAIIKAFKFQTVDQSLIDEILEYIAHGLDERDDDHL